MKKSKRRVKKREYKSSLERWFAVQAKKNGLNFEYEPNRFRFIRVSHYVPDFKVGPQVYVETKGYLAPSDRSKLLAFREQFPDIEIILVFGKASNRINSRSKLTYAEWSTKHGFKWFDMAGGLGPVVVYLKGKITNGS